jgi:hypothetical protein
MLGWHISVYQKVGDADPVTEAVQGKRIAVWQARLFGLRWLDALVKQGHGEYLGGGGWPSRYMFQAKDITPQILAGPPEANEVWIKGPEDIVTDKWEGKTVIDVAAANDCKIGEWLLVQVWDES